MTPKVIIVVAVALASLGVSVAQNNLAVEPGGVSQALEELEQKWVEALVKADTTKLDEIVANTYVDTDEEGNRTDKRGMVAALQSGDLKMASITLSDMRVHAYGDSAVVTGTAAQTGTFRGQSLVPRIVFTDTFVRQNGKWRAVASHRSTVKSQ
jgi:ketosteroid isomerase-like protein